MRYYITADIHGFFDEFKTALAEKGFFTDSSPRKLIVCGDIFDRGSRALDLQSFILDLHTKCSAFLNRERDGSRYRKNER